MPGKEVVKEVPEKLWYRTRVSPKGQCKPIGVYIL